MRRIISEALIQSGIADPAENYDVIPPKGKGVPRILRELIDTYLVTTGDNYNLQVWNRFPNSNSILVQYPNGDCIRCSVFTRRLKKEGFKNDEIFSD